MPGCTFCRIISGTRDAHVLLETPGAMAFLDDNPVTRGHTLVVPKSHEMSLFAEAVSTTVLQVVDRVARAIRQTLPVDGISLMYTSGELVGNVSHAHVHVIPRYAGDGVTVGLERGTIDDDADRLAARLRDTLQ